MGGKIHVLSCSDDFLLASAAKAVADSCAGSGISVETIDGFVENSDAAVRALNSAWESVFQQDFFSSGKVVYLKNVKFFGTDRTSSSETVKEAALQFIERLKTGIPEETALVIGVLGFNKTTRIYSGIKALASSGHLSLEEIPGPSDRKGGVSPAAIVTSHLQTMSKKMSPAVLRSFTARIGSRPRALINELEKLFVYTAGKEPSVVDVEAVVTRYIDDEPWFFLEAFCSRDLRASVKALHDLYDMKVSTVFLVMQLENRVNDMLLLQNAVERGQMSLSTFKWRSDLPPEDAENVSVLGKFDVAQKSPFVLRGLKEHLPQWSRRSLRRARAVLIEAHERIVSVTADDRVILESAVIDAISSAAG